MCPVNLIPLLAGLLLGAAPPVAANKPLLKPADAATVDSQAVQSQKEEQSRTSRDARPKGTAADEPAQAVPMNTVNHARTAVELKKFDAATGTPDCGPFHREVPDNFSPGRVAPALAVYRNKLHLVAQRDYNCAARTNPFIVIRGMGKVLCSDYVFPLFHQTFDGGSWTDADRIPDQSSKKGVGLAAHGNHLHMAHLGNESNQIWHSTYDGNRWSPNVKIPGQKARKRPVLATYGKELHMLHLGDSSDELWHSRYVPGRGWTRNVRIGQKSRFTPALVEYSGRLHMIRASYTNPRGELLVHGTYDGRQWRKHSVLDLRTTTAPALAFDRANGKPWLELTTLLGSRVSHSLISPQRGLIATRPLADIRADSPAAVTFYKGCWHAVSVKNERLMHTTFGTSDIHPDY